ncbi:MAG TPA: hypothetical protein VIV61_05725 [Candidatus Ozemobacteraceae bacterium]
MPERLFHGLAATNALQILTNEDETMNRIRPTAFLTLLCALLLTFAIAGCGGGGGGSSFLAPDTDWQGITGDLDFSALATPTGSFVTAGWPVPAGATSFSVASFSSASASILMLANFNAASQTIVLSAGQASLPSVRGSLQKNDRAFERTHVSDFHAGLRDLEDQYSRISSTPSGSAIRGSVRSVALDAVHVFKVYNNGGYIPVEGKRFDYGTRNLSGVAGKLYVYVDTDVLLLEGGVIETYIKKIIDAWDVIYPTMHGKFGSELMSGETPTGLSLSNDIYILISPKLSEIDPMLAGFFYSGDLYPPERLTTGITNQVKIFYLNLRAEGESRLTEEIMQSTIAHELQHMIFFSNRIRNGVVSDDSWLNETLSAYAESACGFRVDNGKNQSKALQMQYYFDRMNEVPLVQNKGWGSEAQYGQVALFGEWLAEKHKGGDMRSLISSKATGMSAVEEFTGKPFETVFAQWMLAMALDQAGTLYGYANLDWNKEYSFGAGLSTVTLTGPFDAQKNIVTSASLGSSELTLAPMACYFVEFAGGGNGKSLDFIVQPNSGVTVFEFGK